MLRGLYANNSLNIVHDRYLMGMHLRLLSLETLAREDAKFTDTTELYYDKVIQTYTDNSSPVVLSIEAYVRFYFAS